MFRDALHPAVKARQAAAQAAMQATPTLKAHGDRDGPLTFTNQAFARQLGVAPEAVEGCWM